MFKSLVVVLFVVSPSAALTCEFNTDCERGSTCVKGSGLYGLCYGGLSPGNNNDQQPVTDPLDINGTVGNTCSFDTDCGPGNVCAKGSGIDGVCMRR